MNNVTVKTPELLAKIKANRDAHRGVFLKAQEGYRKAVIAELDKMLEEARLGKPIRRAITLPEPQDHTADYDRVIAMLEMEVEAVVELDAHSFDQYVLDNWNWKQLATSTNSFYIQQ